MHVCTWMRIFACTHAIKEQSSLHVHEGRPEILTSNVSFYLQLTFWDRVFFLKFSCPLNPIIFWYQQSSSALMTFVPQLFVWLLETWTQVLMTVQQGLYLLNHSLSFCSIIGYIVSFFVSNYLTSVSSYSLTILTSNYSSFLTICLGYDNLILQWFLLYSSASQHPRMMLILIHPFPPKMTKLPGLSVDNFSRFPTCNNYMPVNTCLGVYVFQSTLPSNSAWLSHSPSLVPTIWTIPNKLPLLQYFLLFMPTQTTVASSFSKDQELG